MVLSHVTGVFSLNKFCRVCLHEAGFVFQSYARCRDHRIFLNKPLVRSTVNTEFRPDCSGVWWWLEACKDGEWTASVGRPFHCVTVLTGERLFYVTVGTFSVSVYFCSLFLLLCTPAESWLYFLDDVFIFSGRPILDSPKLCLLHYEQTEFS